MTATALPVGAERGSAGRALPLAPVLPDARWWLENVPCRTACPVHTDAGGYVTAIAQGRFADAYRIARRPNPFPSICGRVCAAPCETKCRRGAIDAPVAIRALKRFVASRFGVEAARETGGSLWREAIGAPAPDSGKRVAIVGGGPAGLACAHDLRLAGHAVTLFESSAALGGMMVHGIPPFRLPRELIAAEIAGVTELGVEVRLRTRVGVDVRMEALVDTFDAVFVAAGTGVGRRLSVEGRDLPGVTTAVAFLAGSAGEEAKVVGERVVVIGGGSVAFDAARTAARTAALTTDGARPNVAPGDVHGALQALLDVARTARAAGVREVTVVSIEGREELPAEPDEWRQAEREGVRMLHRRSVQAIVGDGRVQGVSLRPVVTVFAPDGRFAPVVDDSAPVERLDCDTVIFAVGQEADTSFLPAPLVRASLAAVDATTLRTSNPKVWAGGDIAFGPRFLINAIADGRRAAAGISAFL
ncbi:MAG TPA: FAD-dependent oxidoreductase, partial [Gemmatimonadaceae bacterium]|nr:FAD-dependent oxidoreductase [Gemmatimonadaceae bacterium]